MGTVNYWTSDYITLGVNPNLFEEYDDTDKLYLYADMYDEVVNTLDCYSFYNFHVEVKAGYYEGFSLYIENNSPVFFDDYIEKMDAQKELTQLKMFLKECVGLGLVQVYPSWCMGYEDSATTLKNIDIAIKEARDEVKSTPTYSQYKRAELPW